MKKISRNKLAAVALAAVLIVSFAPNLAQAANTVSTPGLWDCFKSPATCGIFYASLTLNGVLGLFVSMGAVNIKLGLALNESVFTSATVQKGFSVALALANLGFVFGIIVIALATIIRNQTYGMKQLLWKLVVMAILVNFGLVITGPILGFANNLSSYFINASGGDNGFVTNLTAAFAPQALFSQSDLGTNANVTTILSSPGAGVDDFFTGVLSLIFSAVFLTIVLITFWAIGVLLLIRYLYIAFLLIMLPLAWLTWVFPKFKHLFDEWWSTFIKWAFFPAISLFFIYLAFQSVTLNGTGNVNISQVQNVTAALANNPNLPEFAVTLITKSANVLQTALDEILLCGLCIGGLFAANKIGIKGSEAVVKASKGAAKGGVKALSSWTAKRSARGAASGGSGAARAMATAFRPRPGAPLNLRNRALHGVADAFSRTAVGLGTVAASPSLKTKGLVSTVWGGMKKGSGLFKGKEAHDWACAVCGNTIRSTKKPTAACPVCHSPAATANWTQV